MDLAAWSVLGSALLAGLVFGYCAQRGGFCLTRALSNWVLMGDTATGHLLAYVLVGYPNRLYSRVLVQKDYLDALTGPDPGIRR